MRRTPKTLCPQLKEIIKQETNKRKGRKRKEEESVSPVKKKVKPTKLEIPKEDTNLQIQKLFENSISPQEHISLVEEMKILPQFTTDINPSQQESVSSASKYNTEFTEIKTISSGSYGIVCEARNKRNDKLFAIKKIPINESLLERVHKEIQIHKKLTNYRFIGVGMD